MTRLGRTAVALWLAAAPVAAGADWLATLPEGWLAAVEVRDLDRFDERVGRLRKPLGEPTRSLATAARGLLGAAVADRPWGAALVTLPGRDPAFVVYAPTDDFDAFARALDADRAEDLAIGSLMGFEVAAKPRDGYAAVTLLGTAAALDLPPATPPLSVDADVSVMLSPGGLRFGAEQTARAGGEARVRGRRYSPQRGWPTSLEDLIERLAPAAPVYQTLAEAGRPVTLGLDADDAGVRVVAEWGVAADRSGAFGPAVAADEPIARVALAGAPPRPLIDLALAAIASSPGSLIEAHRFAQPQWDDFAAAAGAVLERVESPAVVLTTPGEAEPLAANQSAAFGWDGSAGEFGDALQLGVLRWNLLMASTRARSPMRVALEPIADEGGWRLSLDVLATGARDPLPEAEAILRRYYGHGDRARVDIVPTEGGHWLATLAPPDQRPTLEQRPANPAPPTADDGLIGVGRLRLDRWLAWDERVRAIGMEDAIGAPEPRPIEPTPAATLRLTAGETLRLELTAPWAAYDAAVRHAAPRE